MRPVSKALTRLYLISSYLNHLINMATQTSSSTTAVAVTKPQDTKETIYSCKWGNVTILNRQNYSVFAATCQYTLVVTDAWEIVKGVEKAPDINTPDGKD